MLDIAKLAKKIPKISQHFRQEVDASYGRLEKAQKILQKIYDKEAELIKKCEKWRHCLTFSVAIPIEPLHTRINLTSPPYSHSVFATDGSEISPSHHEIAYCYLINVGRVMLHYGQNLHPLLDSLPEVYYRPEDIYISKQWGIRTEEWIGYRRSVLEAEILADMACHWVNHPGAHQEPNLAMMDGSLIYWFLDGLPKGAQDHILPPILTAWEQLQKSRIPIVGYLSASRSVESINFLRLHTCPFNTPNCFTNCGDSEEKNLPCQIIEPLRDINLWGQFLEPGQRGPLWRSSQRILELYDETQQIYFCYVNLGSEIARVEVPAWVVEDKPLLEQALGILLGQVSKGYGYPIALSEAHNQAVIRGGDRVRFFTLLEQQMIRAGLQNVGTSYKEVRKRGSIA
ncbi:MAG: DNA double-strand break repair nuclease NurA [cyanobacterium endosymbiont of Rhopalodia musculus]|uniref:DNA double-strand break repair nuclease NurA n=1 Tax=cyanobacterium endosymbiont of Epithemia clementina EcSB TaxID=3034674 RepID=UPI0024805F4D|nr:DNA double-strand break repair nuclease NurA [cyanobacterium endosymbiont of Epithemia clementina EcSB]WGT68246.1 DNA double-strand break repair nuclease NurA [cyanobacterium endosymbiont of Epithemia clementina EcSB]